MEEGGGGGGDEERRDGQVTPSREGREGRVKRKHWKRTGSMVRDSENTVKKDGGESERGQSNDLAKGARRTKTLKIRRTTQTGK